MAVCQPNSPDQDLRRRRRTFICVFCPRSSRPDFNIKTIPRRGVRDKRKLGSNLVARIAGATGFGFGTGCASSCVRRPATVNVSIKRCLRPAFAYFRSCRPWFPAPFNFSMILELNPFCAVFALLGAGPMRSLVRSSWTPDSHCARVRTKVTGKTGMKGTRNRMSSDSLHTLISSLFYSRIMLADPTTDIDRLKLREKSESKTLRDF